jgi:WD40 repeat protein
VWNVTSGTLLYTLSGHSDFVNSITLLDEGQIASGSSDNTLKIWSYN